MRRALVYAAAVLAAAHLVECREHLMSVERDFSHVTTDPRLAHHVHEILERLRVFRVAVHPRVPLFHALLKGSVAEYVRRTADTLYRPDQYSPRHAPHHM